MKSVVDSSCVCASCNNAMSEQNRGCMSHYIHAHAVNAGHVAFVRKLGSTTQFLYAILTPSLPMLHA